MSLEGDLGAEVSLGGFSLETLVGLRAGMDSLVAKIDRIAKIEEAYQFGAVEVSLRGATVSTSDSVIAPIDLGGPTYGRVWQLRRLIVGGAQWGSTVAGSALVVVSANQPSATPPISDVVDQAETLPLPALYGTGQVIIRHPNHLYIVFLSPTASTTYGVGGAATDMPDKRERIDVDR